MLEELSNEEERPLVIVVGQLTLAERMSLASKHPDKHLHFCTCEEDVRSVMLEYTWGIPSALWYETPRESLPLCLLALLDQAEHDGLVVIPVPQGVEEVA